VVVASNLVMNIQTLVSRRIDPSHAAVVTIGKLISGTVNNAIAEYALMEGTVRSSHIETRERIFSCLNRFVEGARKMYNIDIDLTFTDGLPAVINAPHTTEIARSAAERITTVKEILSQGAPSLGGEDFSFYQQHIPGCLVRFGALSPGEYVGPSHSSRFDFHEDVLPVGAAWLSQVAVDSLNTLGEAD
jgi:hippurate hydrolase